MSDTYSMISSININNASDDQLRDYSASGEAGADSLLSGINAIGELAFWASENETFDGKDMRGTLANIGLFLRGATRMVEALNFISEEAYGEMAKRAKDKKVKF